VALLASVAAAATIVVRDPRRKALAMLAAVVLAAIAITAVVGLHKVSDQVSARPAAVAAAALVGLVALAVLVAVVRRVPLAFPLLVVLTVPIRVPVTAGGGSANLLLPLYGVIAAGVLAALWRLREPAAEEEAPAARGETPAGRSVARLEWALAAVLVLYALQSLYSSDREAAVKDLCFFYVPFAVLFVLLLEVRWTPRLLTRAFGLTVGLSLLFALVGFGEWGTGRLLLANEKVLAANDLKPYFRVNSLFFDPNIYGRFLALTMILMAAALLWTRRPRHVALLAAGLAVLWAGLVLSLSQSSFAALLAGLAVLAALRWRPWPVIGLVGIGAALVIAVVLIAPGALHIKGGSSKALDKATSGRVDLLRGGGRLFSDRPVWGVGSGGFAKSYRKRERIRTSSSAVVVSHTIPVTVAAEQGVIGLLGYAALMLAALAMLLRGLRDDLVRRGPPGPAAIARAAIAAAFIALVLHTLVYAAFLEDPLSWTLLAVGAALALLPPRPRVRGADRAGGRTPGAHAAPAAQAG
jgi:putative inorganic carbon (HCO3(-)) transporter